MAFFKKFISSFNISEDSKNEYLALDYQILLASLMAAVVPLAGRFIVDQQKKSYFGASSELIHNIINRVKETPFLYFQNLKEKSFPVIRAKIEDPTGEIRQAWIDSYLKRSSASFSKILGKVIKVTNPQNSSENINIVIPNFKVLNNEIAGFQILAANQNNLTAHYLCSIDTDNAFKNITEKSPQFFNLSDVYISGSKVSTDQDGEHLFVTHIFTKVRDSLNDVEKEGIEKVKKILLYISAGIALFAVAMSVRIYFKKQKLINKKKQLQ